MNDERKAVPSAKLIALLDDPTIAAAVRVPGEERGRVVEICLPPTGAMSAQAISASVFAMSQGSTVSVFRQTAGQIAGALGGDVWGDDLVDFGRREWSGSLDVKFEDVEGLHRMLDRAVIDPWGRYIDHAYAGHDGLLTRKPEPTPLPPPTMTRQQRRYLARKGRTND